MADLDLNSIIQVDFPKDQYKEEETEKKQIILHHTVSGKGVTGDIEYWEGTPEKVATTVIIDWQGKIYQLFSSKFWAHHIGLKATTLSNMGYPDYNIRNEILNKQSIGIEIDSWGGLVQQNNLWYPAKWDIDLKRDVANTNVKPIQNVQVYPQGFKGYYGYEKYTPEQIESVRQLLVYWGKRYNIPLTYNEEMWKVSHNALSGNAGVWTHVSFRDDKSDCHPQPELIQMLKSL